METQSTRMPVDGGQSTIAIQGFSTTWKVPEPRIGMAVEDPSGRMVSIWLTPNEARQLAAWLRTQADGLDPAGA